MFRLRHFTQGRHGALVWRAWVWKHLEQALGVGCSSGSRSEEEEGRGADVGLFRGRVGPVAEKGGWDLSQLSSL